jgi:hypothetical protein
VSLQKKIPSKKWIYRFRNVNYSVGIGICSAQRQLDFEIRCQAAEIPLTHVQCTGNAANRSQAST